MSDFSSVRHRWRLRMSNDDGRDGSKLHLMSNPIRLIFAATFLCQFTGPARPEGGNPTLGKRLAQEWCAKCHAIGRFGASPLQGAPPFRDLHSRYNVEDLAESLAEGIMTGHPSMPVFRFDPDQIENLIAYLKTLEKQ
jgi:cytochrome c